MIEIIDELRRLVEKLDEQSIDYALCGGMAMAVHQLPRMTVDIDLLILPESLDSTLAVARELNYTIRKMDLSFAQARSKSVGSPKSILTAVTFCHSIFFW